MADLDHILFLLDEPEPTATGIQPVLPPLDSPASDADLFRELRRTAASRDAVVTPDDVVTFVGGDARVVRRWLDGAVTPLKHPAGEVVYRWGDLVDALVDERPQAAADNKVRRAAVDPAPDSPVVTVRVAAKLLRCGTNKVFELLKTGRLVRAVGVPARGTHVTRVSLRAFVAAMTPPLPPPKPPRRGSRLATRPLPDPEVMRANLREQRRLLRSDVTPT